MGVIPELACNGNFKEALKGEGDGVPQGTGRLWGPCSSTLAARFTFSRSLILKVTSSNTLGLRSCPIQNTNLGGLADRTTIRCSVLGPTSGPASRASRSAILRTVGTQSPTWTTPSPTLRLTLNSRKV